MHDNHTSIDPVLRCDSCQGLARLETLHALGCCPGCGNKRMRNVLVLNEDERAQVKAWGIDDFLTLFRAVPDV